ncbi:hypothetical protein GLV94_12390 [Virgibacillus halodenitrificans]|uniref:DUF3006 family protein n=2 Tax=Virgibacillus halodenitrificans TaxID=1482 RepID=A0ABR7VLB2_VIRHA|nr:hypothetical protein [Virgibacillus halodenitrificans]MBD1222066.1 hypothetical protein [Virgibacillus halodenitrificans]MYL46441.1 hypothetical protein [Virgibacillus halodenitrificans]
MSRLNEISNHTGTEICLFEPKKDDKHLEGDYYVGIIVPDSLTELPSGMEYIEVKDEFVVTRGSIMEIGELHSKLGEWAKEQGYYTK